MGKTFRRTKRKEQGNPKKAYSKQNRQKNNLELKAVSRIIENDA